MAKQQTKGVSTQTTDETTVQSSFLQGYIVEHHNLLHGLFLLGKDRVLRHEIVKLGPSLKSEKKFLFSIPIQE